MAAVAGWLALLPVTPSHPSRPACGIPRHSETCSSSSSRRRQRSVAISSDRTTVCSVCPRRKRSIAGRQWKPTGAGAKKDKSTFSRGSNWCIRYDCCVQWAVKDWRPETRAGYSQGRDSAVSLWTVDWHCISTATLGSGLVPRQITSCNTMP